MSIDARLFDELRALSMRGVEYPDSVFLGKSEFQEMRAIAKRFAVIKDETVSTFKWNGMEVLEVNRPNYIGFGLVPPSPAG